MDLGGWCISEKDENGNIHCVPLNDLREHITEDCLCMPVVDEELGLIVHNSFDGREEFETNERKVS